ncbi:glycosyltransferase family 39 protein [uncultured Prochlorococcus sp.]|uniref:glycosyltransferase family 39 protein n=1 Tax=uncultured Prochlorococcus sp. TaxID=159733 RepID=UPI00258CDFB1|nr:glycosyltransferase family 39 protein [uncultured Prochlorococcus sp.]
MIITLRKSDYIKLIIICSISIALDLFFFIDISSPPAWDQGYHLSNLFKMYNIISNDNINLDIKLNRILNVTDNYRGPLTYFLSSLKLFFINNSYKVAYISNHIFNTICIISIFELGKLIKDSKTGFWASIFFTFSPFIIKERTDYLIDLSLTSFTILYILVLTKWHLSKKEISIYSFLSGINLALIFLTRPTGIIIFIIPTIILFLQKCKKKISKKIILIEVLIFFFTFILLIFPWFSRHWITIISSILNAFKWGVNYQEGLDYNTFEGWLFYLKKIPDIFGIINFIIIFIILLSNILNRNNLKNLINKFRSKELIWLAVISLNFYIVISLMSTKDLRFFMPIYPVICIYLSLIFNYLNLFFFRNKLKIMIMIFSLSLSMIFQINDYKKIIVFKNDIFLESWPHKQIIKEIEKQSPYYISTLAILPDTKEINTFNLEAEAVRQGEKVAIRQVVSNKESYKDDLKYFDWFLVKTEDQGVMTSESKELLQNYLSKNQSFIVHKEWQLKDKSKVSLYKRKVLNSYIKESKCSSQPSIDISEIDNGIKLKLISTGKIISSSNLLVDFISENLKINENFSIAQGLLNDSLNDSNCYEVIQNLPIEKNKFKQDKKIFFNAKILNSSGETFTLPTKKNYINFSSNEINNLENILMENKIKEVEKLGQYLERGQFENLFNMVGILNQSDPRQAYLKDSEMIYKKRYSETNNLDYLYNVLISQILQRRVKNAYITVNKILNIEKPNGNTYLTKSIINTYLIRPKEAQEAINKAKIYNKSSESEKILDPLKRVVDIMNLKL